jgi:antitoxin CptB
MTMHLHAGDQRELERVRWRCRRGLLELDIVLMRFIERYQQLDDGQRNEFDRLLDLPDTLLWDMICGRMPAVDTEQQDLLALINRA